MLTQSETIEDQDTSGVIARDRFLAGVPFRTLYPTIVYKFIPTPNGFSDPVLLTMIERNGQKRLTNYCPVFDITDEGFQLDFDTGEGYTFRRDIYFEEVGFVTKVEEEDFSNVVMSTLIKAMSVFLSPE